MAKGAAGECAACGGVTLMSGGGYLRNIHTGCEDSYSSGCCYDCRHFGAAGYACVNPKCATKPVIVATAQASAPNAPPLHLGSPTAAPAPTLGAAGTCVVCKASTGKYNICVPLTASCATVNNSGDCTNCRHHGAAGYPCVHCTAAPLIQSYASLIAGQTVSTTPVYRAAPASRTFAPTLLGSKWPSESATSPKATRVHKACTSCARLLCAELDAYYGRDPIEAGRCSKCRGRTQTPASAGGIL